MTGDKLHVTGDKFAVSGVAGRLQPGDRFVVNGDKFDMTDMIHYAINVGKLHLNRSYRTRRQLYFFCSSLKRLSQSRCSSTLFKDDHSSSHYEQVV